MGAINRDGTANLVWASGPDVPPLSLRLMAAVLPSLSQLPLFARSDAAHAAAAAA
jgi:hypothetical protein